MKPPPFTVALLDDDSAVLKAMTRLFRSAGWDVSAFDDPMLFLDHAITQQPPVAVIDVVMPLMDGLDVQTRLRELSPGTEVVILTSLDDDAARERARAAGAFAYVDKSTDANELFSVIASASVRRTQPASPASDSHSKSEYESPLEQAERHVRESRERVEDQMADLAEFEHHGQTEAIEIGRKLLKLLEDSRAHAEEHLRRLKEEAGE